MLKRQRGVSPPGLPTLSESPFITDPVDLGLIERHHKKQRILPPSLDGPSRGWAKPHEHHLGRFTPSNNDDDDEDDEEDDDEEEYDTDNAQCALSSATPGLITAYASPYKSTNELLRELHAVNQHRLLFASPSQSQVHSQSQSQGQSQRTALSALHNASGSGLHQQHHNQHHNQHQHQHQHHNQQQQHHNQQHHFSAGNGMYHNHAPHFEQTSSSSHFAQSAGEWPRSVHSLPAAVHFQGADKEYAVEVSRVTERYESTNRLLGSLVLSRRKQLGDDEHLTSP